MSQKNDRMISSAVVRRLPRYYRFLGELMDRGIDRISSAELSRSMGITASQIRQDLNHFGGFGQQGYGYNVKYLHDVIGGILGLTKEYSIIIIGAGRLGSALANYGNFDRKGFKIQALFDIDSARIGKKIQGHEIFAMDMLEDYLSSHKTDIAVLSLPKAAAQEAADRLVRCAIPAIWNFASVDLAYPESSVIVENVHLSDSLMTLSYRLGHREN